MSPCNTAGRPHPYSLTLGGDGGLTSFPLVGLSVRWANCQMRGENAAWCCAAPKVRGIVALHSLVSQNPEGSKMPPDNKVQVSHRSEFSCPVFSKDTMPPCLPPCSPSQVERRRPWSQPSWDICHVKGACGTTIKVRGRCRFRKTAMPRRRHHFSVSDSELIPQNFDRKNPTQLDIFLPFFGYRQVRPDPPERWEGGLQSAPF